MSRLCLTKLALFVYAPMRALLTNACRIHRIGINTPLRADVPTTDHTKTPVAAPSRPRRRTCNLPGGGPPSPSGS